MADDELIDGGEAEVPQGAAVFPPIPAELGVQPLLLAVLHAIVFLAGSDEDIVQPEAGGGAVQHSAASRPRLRGEAWGRVREDMAVLVRTARQQGWSKQQV